jgi:hypothetical protein
VGAEKNAPSVVTFVRSVTPCRIRRTTAVRVRRGQHAVAVQRRAGHDELAGAEPVVDPLAEDAADGGRERERQQQAPGGHDLPGPADREGAQRAQHRRLTTARRRCGPARWTSRAAPRRGGGPGCRAAPAPGSARTAGGTHLALEPRQARAQAVVEAAGEREVVAGVGPPDVEAVRVGEHLGVAVGAAEQRHDGLAAGSRRPPRVARAAEKRAVTCTGDS